MARFVPGIRGGVDRSTEGPGPTGLSSAEARVLLERHGPNRRTEPPRSSDAVPTDALLAHATELGL